MFILRLASERPPVFPTLLLEGKEVSSLKWPDCEKQGVVTRTHVRPQAEPATAGRRWSGALAEASERSERSAVSERRLASPPPFTQL